MAPQCLLWTPVRAGAPAGAGEQCVPVAVSRKPVQGPRYLLLLLGDGDVHQRPGRTDRCPQGECVTAQACLRPTVFIPF